MGATKSRFLQAARVVAALVLTGMGVGASGARAQLESDPTASMGAPSSMAGRSPAEIAASLESQGIPPERVQQMLMEMRATPQTSTTSPLPAEVPPPPVERETLAPPKVFSDSANGSAPLFGYSLFESSPDSYRQPASGPVDPSYPLGPGDEIVLDVWGDAVFRLERTLDREGGVNLPDVGRVVLAGMTLDGARETLRRRLAAVYSGLSENDARATTHLSVTLGNLRVIRAFVVGRTKRPGGYDLSAASTVFHALFFAGGPTLGGSMRDIRLVRGGKDIAKLDVYEYLRSGKRNGDVRLENDDTIFVPPVGARVTVQGEVREPGIYELLPGETLDDLVTMSGGFTEKAFSGRVQVERILSYDEQIATREDRKVLDTAFDEAGRATTLADGDVITVFPVADRLRNFVSVNGEVRRPGTYELAPGERVGDVIARAGGLLETAFLDRAEIVRTHADDRREQIAIDLRPLGRPASPEEREHANAPLEPRDQITIHSIWALRDAERVSIYGAVRAPGAFELRENMTLRDLLLEAGGLQPNAYRNEVEISRVLPGMDRSEPRAHIFRVPLGESYLTSAEGDFHLEPHDNVFVREEPTYELQRNISITGEVRFPGVYTLTNPRERLSSVIQRAGGLTASAFPDGFTLFREKDGVGRIALDLGEALKKPLSNDDLVLFAGDSLNVPEEPKTVTVRGEVGYPTSLVHMPGWSIGDYIAMAGGTTEKADRGQTRVVYSTGAAARVKKYWADPEVRPGSTIVVPAKPERQGVEWGSVFRETTAVLASIATIILVVDNVGS